MKKKIIVIGATAILTGSIFLTGCSNPNIVYEGVERPQSEVAEIISDKLEVENPGLDINVTIIQGVED